LGARRAVPPRAPAEQPFAHPHCRSPDALYPPAAAAAPQEGLCFVTPDAQHAGVMATPVAALAATMSPRTARCGAYSRQPRGCGLGRTL
jgi:hypothetical protein